MVDYFGMTGDDDTVPSGPTASGGPAFVDRNDPEVRRILVIARDLLAANGYAGLKVPNVVNRAQISTRRFYRYFDSKVHLLRALYEDEAAGIGRRIDRSLAASDDPVEKLDRYVYELIRPAVEPGLRPRALRFALVRVEVIAEFGVELWQMNTPPDVLVALIDEGIATGVFQITDSAAAAKAIFNLCSGTMYTSFALDPETAREALEIARSAARRIVELNQP